MHRYEAVIRLRDWANIAAAIDGVRVNTTCFTTLLDFASAFASAGLRTASPCFVFFFVHSRLPWLSTIMLPCGDGVDDRPSPFL